MTTYSRYVLSLLLISLPIALSAQQAEMADALRADGKIYVVVGVVFILFTVLVSYVAWLDIRLRKAEKNKGQ